MEDPWGTALALFQVWISVLLCLVMLPAMFGLSLGVTGVYIKILVRILEVSTPAFIPPPMSNCIYCFYCIMMDVIASTR